MRLIWTLSNPDLLLQFCRILEAHKIDFKAEQICHEDWGSDTYGTLEFRLWIVDEDQVEKAKELYNQFLNNSFPSIQQADLQGKLSLDNTTKHIASSPQFRLPHELYQQQSSKKSSLLSGFRTSVRYTLLLICICSTLFCIETIFQIQKDTLSQNETPNFLFSPIKRSLLIDFPQHWEIISELVPLYSTDNFSSSEQLLKQRQLLLQKAHDTPYWQGIYPTLVMWCQSLIKNNTFIESKVLNAPLFEKIRSDYQIWRLWTPSLLHQEFLHLFFNMVWLSILGTQIEPRLGFLRYLALLSILALISNVAQYLVSGPNFIGFSGILCGMITFIYMRQKYFPWEGYQLSSSSFTFICLFITTLFGLSVLSFLLTVWQNTEFAIAIANTAHITGALTGLYLGRLQVFAWNRESPL